MIKNLIVLPDGTEIYSGVDQENALQNVSYTECVNSDAELTLGSVCSNMVEATIISPNGSLTISAGTEVTLYKVDDAGTRYKVGPFILEKPTRASANSYKITAYDRISKLDEDLTEWLSGLNEWPYALFTFAQMVCTACGLSLKNADIPNGSYMVRKFSGDGVTGRSLMRMVGEACARFCRADADGNIEFAWYTESGKTITASGELYYFQGSLSYEDYQVAQIQKVQIRQEENDVGVVYPTDAEGEVNTYVVERNYLLTADTADELLPVAQAIFEQIRNVLYTPCQVSIPATQDIHAGNIVQITDINGVTITTYVMTKTQSGQKDTLECTGGPSRDSSSVRNNEELKALSGKVFTLQKGIDGLRIENRELDEKYASIALDVDSVSTEVSKQTQELDDIRTSVSTIQQTADNVTIQVQKIAGDGVTKVNTGLGLTIDETCVNIHRDGSEMSNSLDENGMYVIRSKGTDNETTMLQADADGVEATNLTAKNFLIIGHARFEAYEDGVGCFYV